MTSLMFFTGCAESWLVTRMASNASFLHSPKEWALEGTMGSEQRGVEVIKDIDLVKISVEEAKRGFECECLVHAIPRLAAPI
jgi:hypothetical protein